VAEGEVVEGDFEEPVLWGHPLKRPRRALGDGSGDWQAPGSWGRGPGMKKLRGRWTPTPQQISVAIDCAVARMPITRAAELLGIKPRTLWVFARRVDLPVFGAWKDRPRYVPFSGPPVGSRAAETSAAGIPAPEAVP
jgi:hypothetical protein